MRIATVLLTTVYLVCGVAAGEPNAKPAKAPGEKAVARAAKLKAAIKDFSLELRYQGNQANRFDSLALTLRPKYYAPARHLRAVAITEVQAVKIIDYLAAEGFLDEAHEGIWNLERPPGAYNYYNLLLRTGDPYHEVKENLAFEHILGWDKPMLARLDGLRKVLDGKPAEAMDALLAKLAGQRAEWDKPQKDNRKQVR